MLTAFQAHGLTFKVFSIRISNKITGIESGLEVIQLLRDPLDWIFYTLQWSHVFYPDAHTHSCTTAHIPSQY
jgi:hypothetical protein